MRESPIASTVQPVCLGRKIKDAASPAKKFSSNTAWATRNGLQKALLQGVDPLGKVVSVEGNPYQVVGVAKALGSVFGQSQDNFVMIPIESYFKTYGSRNGLRLVAKAIDQAHLGEAEDETPRADALLSPPPAGPG